MWPFRNDGRSKVTAVLSKLQDLVALLREWACNKSTGRIDCSFLINRCSSRNGREDYLCAVDGFSSIRIPSFRWLACL
jgi:hypothetical protein